ncbi:MAG: hypothetical protein H6738_19825 [Alphaproteobacteria bacterium]|nr:hypothetical protein [Alphaproteobacteria bacterium]MCB9699040.1 hypothetical protein [Alphaproteobacteria bacterium]
MWHLMLSVSLAADAPTEAASGTVPLVVDCKVPAEILVDKVKLGELHYPGKAEFELPPGAHQVRVYVAGNPTDLDVVAAAGTTIHVLAGKTGVTTQTTGAAASAVADQFEVSVRVVGVPAVQIRLDDGRQVVQSGPDTVLVLAPGQHRLSIRSADGTAIWSTGILEVHGKAVLQLSEGRMPEVSGGATFHAGT